MKKIIFTLIVALSSISAFAQITIVDDTVSYTQNAGCVQKTGFSLPADGVVLNNTNVATTIKWTLVSANLPNGWFVSQICDNLSCRDSANLKANSGPITSAAIPVNASMNLTVDIKAHPGSADGIGYVTVNIASVGDIVYKFSTCPLGTKDFDNSNFVNIYPNPATNHINIALNDKNISSVNVTNVIGNKIAKFAVDVNRSPIYISLDNVSTGVYLLQFVDSKGKIIGVKKVTKQ